MASVVLRSSAIRRSLRFFQFRNCASRAAAPQIKSSISDNDCIDTKNAPDDDSSVFVQWVVDETQDKSRLDRFVKRKAPGLPQGFIQRLIRQGKIRVGGSPPRQNAYPLSTNDVVEVPGDVKLGLSRGKRKPSPDDTTLKEAEIIKTWVLHRDARCVVLNKPGGIATQGGTDIGERHVEAYLSGIGAGRYWLVHRLDKEVSGCLIVARDVGAAGILAEYFRNREVTKTYWALVHGVPYSPSGLITADVAGKSAVTAYRVMKSLGDRESLLELKPRTGRKHQLRIHCANVLGTPIQGDDKYGDSEDSSIASRSVQDDAIESELHLHARSVQFPPLTKVHASNIQREQNEVTGSIYIEAPLPDHIQKHWKSIGLVEHDVEDLHRECLNLRNRE